MEDLVDAHEWRFLALQFQIRQRRQFDCRDDHDLCLHPTRHIGRQSTRCPTSRHVYPDNPMPVVAATVAL
jgi:hypothetical protein